MFLKNYYLKQIGFEELPDAGTDYWHEDVFEFVSNQFENETSEDLSVHITVKELIDFLDSVRWTIMSSIKELIVIWEARENEFAGWMEYQETNPIWEIREEQIRY